MMNGRRWKINTTTLWCREKSHEPWNLVSQFRRRDSISLNRWLVYRLQLLNHRVSSSSSCRVVGHRDHNLFRFFRLARRLSIFLFSITSVRARHPQDLRRRRSSLPTGNSLEYRPIPLSSFHRSNDIFPLTKPRFRSQSVYNRFDTTKWIRSVPFHEFFLLSSAPLLLPTGKVIVVRGVFERVGVSFVNEDRLIRVGELLGVNRASRVEYGASRREIARFVGVVDDGVHWRRLMGVVVALANLRLGLRIGFN